MNFITSYYYNIFSKTIIFLLKKKKQTSKKLSRTKEVDIVSDTMNSSDYKDSFREELPSAPLTDFRRKHKQDSKCHQVNL